MRKVGVAAFLGGVCAIGMMAAVQHARAADASAAEQQHIALATTAAGNDYKDTNLWLCKPTKDQLAHLATMSKDTPPAKVFDDFYYFGSGPQGVWALKTSAGIILFDTHANAEDAERYIIGGFKKVGLDPKDIKYIILAHGHGDHYGGTLYFQEKYPAARVMMSQADYYLADTAAVRPNWGGAPKHDMIVNDGDKLTLGDTTITLYITPGHTPGTLSAIIPVQDHGKTRILAMWGGTSPPPNRDGILTQEESLKRFTRIAEQAHVDGWVSNHGLWDGAPEKLARLAKNPNGPNPFLQDADLRHRYFVVQDECLQAALARVATPTQ